MALDLTSVHAKLARAEEHLRAFHEEQTSWGHPDVQDVVRKNNADFTQWKWFIRVKQPVDFTRGSLLFADGIHNMRCALDHLAYSIATFEHNGPSEVVVSDGFMFPLAHNEGKFKKAVKDKRLDPLSERAIGAIESVQPYKRFLFERDGRKFSRLGLLRDLDNHDKHRIIHQSYQLPVAVDTHPIRAAYQLPAADVMEARVASGPLEDGAEVATLTIRKPAPDLNPTFDPAIAVLIEWPDWADPNNPNDRGALHAPGVLVQMLAEVREVVGIVSAAAG